MKKHQKHRLAPAGTRERAFQDIMRKAGKASKRLTKKRGKRKKVGPHRAQTQHEISDFNKQYCGSVVDSVSSSNSVQTINYTASPAESCMHLFGDSLEDKKDEQYT